MPRINLIPWRETERKRKRQEFGVGALGAVIVAGLMALLVNFQMGAAIDNQLERNQYLNDEIAKLDKQITEILALEQQKQRLRARIQVIEQLERSRPEIVHVFDQLVRTIPESGRKSLYVASHAGRIFGMPEAEGRALIDELIAHTTQRQFVYTHRWRPNELVLWDNRLCVHQAFNDYQGHRREMYRTTIAGEKPR